MTAPSNGQPPPPFDPFNSQLAPVVDGHSFVMFLPPGGQPGVVGITLRTASGELTVMASKAKAQTFARQLLTALDAVPDPSGLIVPAGTDPAGFTRSLRLGLP